MIYHLANTKPIKELLSQFYDIYPGPFAVVRSTDGCDATFDVVCSETMAHIISVPYWEAERQARREAEAVALFLNQM